MGSAHHVRQWSGGGVLFPQGVFLGTWAQFSIERNTKTLQISPSYHRGLSQCSQLQHLVVLTILLKKCNVIDEYVPLALVSSVVLCFVFMSASTRPLRYPPSLHEHTAVLTVMSDNTLSFVSDDRTVTIKMLLHRPGACNGTEALPSDLQVALQHRYYRETVFHIEPKSCPTTLHTNNPFIPLLRFFLPLSLLPRLPKDDLQRSTDLNRLHLDPGIEVLTEVEASPLSGLSGPDVGYISSPVFTAGARLIVIDAGTVSLVPLDGVEDPIGHTRDDDGLPDPPLSPLR